jgi:Flp pilus assembly pilin Flp
MKGRAPRLLRLGRRRWVVDSRGASMVEYALMLFLILCVAALAVTLLGKKVRLVTDSATMSF